MVLSTIVVHAPFIIVQWGPLKQNLWTERCCHRNIKLNGSLNFLGQAFIGIHPVGLKITGWTFDCQVKWKQGDDRWCKFTHPQRLWRDGIEIRPSGVKQRRLRQLLGLILLNTEDGDIQFLIIEQQENGDRFERLDIGTAFKHNQ
jgi:hypothetical protein